MDENQERCIWAEMLFTILFIIVMTFAVVGHISMELKGLRYERKPGDPPIVEVW